MAVRVEDHRGWASSGVPSITTRKSGGTGRSAQLRGQSAKRLLEVSALRRAVAARSKFASGQSWVRAISHPCQDLNRPAQTTADPGAVAGRSRVRRALVPCRLPRLVVSIKRGVTLYRHGLWTRLRYPRSLCIG